MKTTFLILAHSLIIGHARYAVTYQSKIETYQYDDDTTRYGIRQITLSRGKHSYRAVFLYGTNKRTVTDLIFKSNTTISYTIKNK